MFDAASLGSPLEVQAVWTVGPRHLHFALTSTSRLCY